MKLDHRHIISMYTHSAATNTIYYEEPKQLNARVEYYLKLVEEFIKDEELSSLYKLDSFSFTLLPILNDAVNVFENESELKTKHLLARELFILMGTLLTLILESIFIVIPTINRASIHEEKLNSLVKERTLELERISAIDKLTNLFNRGKLMKLLLMK